MHVGEVALHLATDLPQMLRSHRSRVANHRLAVWVSSITKLTIPTSILAVAKRLPQCKT